MLKLMPKYTALFLLINLVPSVYYWIMIGDVLLAVFPAMSFISCFIWVWTDEVLRKRETIIQYNAIFRYKEGRVYITFPDFSTISSSADTRAEAYKIAEESLIEVLQGKRHLDIPDKTPRERIKIWEDTEIVEIEVVMRLNNEILEKRTE